MAENSHDASEDGFHEIQLSGKQLVFLCMTATVVSILIFLCGVLVGRDFRNPRPGESAGMLAAAPLSAADAGAYAAEPATPAEMADELSYHRRLQGEDGPSEAITKPPVDPPPSAPPARPAARPAAPAAQIAADVPTSGRPGKLVVQVFASQDGAAASSLVKRLASKGYPAFLVPPVDDGTPPMYKVQVGRYNDRRDAEEVSRRLEKEEQFKPWISSR